MSPDEEPRSQPERMTGWLGEPAPSSAPLSAPWPRASAIVAEMKNDLATDATLRREFDEVMVEDWRCDLKQRDGE